MKKKCLQCDQEFSFPPTRKYTAKYCSRICYGKAKLSAVDDFWRRVNKHGPNGCWEWTGSRSLNGYGTLGWNHRHVAPHRLAWELTFGPIAEGLVICHKCHNRLCCNPKHIRADTAFSNNQDMLAAGRCGTEKLSEATVREIRAKRKDGIRQKILAKEYGLCEMTVSRILRGLTYKRFLDS